MNPLRVLQAGTIPRHSNSCCADLMLVAMTECGAFTLATKELFGDRWALCAGSLWVEALESDRNLQCRASSFRKVTIVAAGMLADLMGVPRRVPDASWAPTGPIDRMIIIKSVSAPSLVMQIPIEQRFEPIATFCGVK